VTRESAMEDEGNEWDGRIGALKSFIGRMIKGQDDKQERRMNQLKDEVNKG